MLSLDKYNESQTTQLKKNSSHDCCDHHSNSFLNQTKENCCPVCLDDEPDTILLPCSHSFHGECILKWVSKNFTCPMCRGEIKQFVPLKNDKKIHEQFTKIWEEHYVTGSKEKQEKPLVDDEILKQKETQKTKVEEKTDTTTTTLPTLLNTNFETRLMLINSLLEMHFIKNKNKLFVTKRITKRPIEGEKLNYSTWDNIRAGLCSGFLTASSLLLQRQRPVFRQITPSVACYFTAYEHTKKIVGRRSNSNCEIFGQCFTAGCVGGLAYIPYFYKFPFYTPVHAPLVPLQFGLHFGMFEVLKNMLAQTTGRERLGVGDVALTAMAGGIFGSLITYPLARAPLVQLEGVGGLCTSSSLYDGLMSHCIRKCPGWAVTACGFEFSRRLITNT